MRLGRSDRFQDLKMKKCQLPEWPGIVGFKIRIIMPAGFAKKSDNPRVNGGRDIDDIPGSQNFYDLKILKFPFSS